MTGKKITFTHYDQTIPYQRGDCSVVFKLVVYDFDDTIAVIADPDMGQEEIKLLELTFEQAGFNGEDPELHIEIGQELIEQAIKRAKELRELWVEAQEEEKEYLNLLQRADEREAARYPHDREPLNWLVIVREDTDNALEQAYRLYALPNAEAVRAFVTNHLVARRIPNAELKPHLDAAINKAQNEIGRQQFVYHKGHAVYIVYLADDELPYFEQGKKAVWLSGAPLSQDDLIALYRRGFATVLQYHVASFDSAQGLYNTIMRVNRGRLPDAVIVLGTLERYLQLAQMLKDKTVCVLAERHSQTAHKFHVVKVRYVGW